VKWCEDHWTRLRDAVQAKPELGGLIATTGERAAANTVAELEKGKLTLTDFDPLMNAFWAVNANASRIIGETGGPSAALYLLAPPDVPEDAVDRERYPKAAEGATWPRCPLCYLGLAHKLTCEGCDLPTVDGFGWMIGRAADDQVEVLAKLRAEEAQT
jgi:hypothetical protein